MEHEELQRLDNADLLQLTLELYSRAVIYHRSEAMHKKAMAAVDELKTRLEVDDQIEVKPEPI